LCKGNKNKKSEVAKNVDFKFTYQMPTELNDEQLMLKYAKGDVSAFELLYFKHKGGLFRYCLRQFSSQAIAEECFQDIWMKVINNRINYQPKALFSTYLYRIAQNHVIDIFRKEKKRMADCEYEESSDHVVQLANQVNETEKQDQQDLVVELRKQINMLPFEQKNTLLLKLDAGLSLDEISHILDCGKETVKSRLRYATSKLKELLAEPSLVENQLIRKETLSEHKLGAEKK